MLWEIDLVQAHLSSRVNRHNSDQLPGDIPVRR